MHWGGGDTLSCSPPPKGPTVGGMHMQQPRPWSQVTERGRRPSWVWEGGQSREEVFSACTYCCQSSTMSLCHF